MRLHEVAHHINFLIIEHVPQEDRGLVLEYVESGFNQDGECIPHAEHQESMLRCLDCPNAPHGCDDCETIPEKYRKR